MSNGEAFGLAAATEAEAPLDPSTFNLDDWIDGASRATEKVTIYGKGHLHERLRDLDEQMAQAEREPASEQSVTEKPRLAALEEEWEQVAAELVGSKLVVRVQALTSDELQAALEEGRKAGANETDRYLWVIAAGCVGPKFTVQQLRRLREKSGDAGVTLLLNTITRLSNHSVRPTVPFSQKPLGGRRG